MIKVVKQQGFKRKKIKVKKLKNNQSKKVFEGIKISSNALWIGVIIIIFVFGLYVILKKTLLKQENIIREVQIASDTLEQYDNPYIIKDIKTAIIGENIYLIKLFGKKDLLKLIQETYPIVKKISISKVSSYTAVIEVQFYPPDLVVQSQDKKFGYYESYSFTIFSGNQIGTDVVSFELPLYASGAISISGLFFDKEVEVFKSNIILIQNVIPDIKRIVYLVGGDRILLVLDDKKRIYINLGGDIEAQLHNLLWLQEYYEGYVDLSTIDLGSLKEGEVIVS